MLLSEGDQFVECFPCGRIVAQCSGSKSLIVDEIRGLIIVVQDTAWLLGTGRSQTEVFFGFGEFVIAVKQLRTLQVSFRAAVRLLPHGGKAGHNKHGDDTKISVQGSHIPII